jgi:hypothetical protein
VSERGLVAGDDQELRAAAGAFLEDRVARVGGLELDRLTAGDVCGSLARECPRRTTCGAMALVANLRPLLRYLRAVGAIEVPLV